MIFAISIMLLLLLPGTWCAQSIAEEDALDRAKTWQPMPWETAYDLTQQWLLEAQVPEAATQEILQTWQAANDKSPQDVFETTIDSIRKAVPDAADLIDRARRGEIQTEAEWERLNLDAQPGWASNNLKLLFGKSLAVSQLYDESKAILGGLQPRDVADPAGLLFYRAVSHYRLRERDIGIEALDKLLEQESVLPERYAAIAKLMRSDLEKLKEDSLDEVARIMDSIGVRLGHGHAGMRTRDEEQDVIDKLDAMIEELEQQQQQQMAQAGDAGGTQSNSPAQDSSLPGGRGQGDVGSKDLGDKTDWGNMPPKKREEAMQQLGKEFPAHYRDVIEEYFRRLARNKRPEE